MTRVFISSVVNGFEDERTVACNAVKATGAIPILSENFVASPKDPRSVCLTEVEKSNVYVGILGDKYGWVSSSGLSVTHEEYEHAKKLAIPRYIFISEGAKEPKQADLINQIESYERGVFRNKYSNTSDLYDKIYAALISEVEATSPFCIGARDAEAIFSRKEPLNRGALMQRGESHPATRFSIVPANQRDDYFALMQLGNAVFQRGIKKALLYEIESSIFSDEHGIKTSTTQSGVLFEQLIDGKFGAAVYLDSCGLIQVVCSIRPPQGHGIMNSAVFSDMLLDLKQIRENTRGAIETVCGIMKKEIGASNSLDLFSLFGIYNSGKRLLATDMSNIPGSAQGAWGDDEDFVLWDEPKSFTFDKLDSGQSHTEIIYEIEHYYKSEGRYWDASKSPSSIIHTG